MKNTDLKERSLDEGIKRLIVWASRLFLTGLAVGLGPWAFQTNQELGDLKAQDKVAKEQIKVLQEKANRMEKQVDQLHWHLIRKPKIELPEAVK